MINYKLLTNDNGFDEGVVVEIVWKDGIKLWQQVGGFPWLPGDFENVIFIRPLTGFMSIWNHAPGWAQWCQIFQDGIEWFATPFETIPDHGATKRPFWANHG